MKLWVLGSGSAGNAVLVECGESRVLVDAGFGTRELASRLRTIGVAPASIEACVVTHEHTDHIKGAAAGARRWGWSLFASAGTVNASPELQDAACTVLTVGASVALSRVQVTTYATPHDAEETCISNVPMIRPIDRSSRCGLRGRCCDPTTGRADGALSVVRPTLPLFTLGEHRPTEYRLNHGGQSCIADTDFR